MSFFLLFFLSAILPHIMREQDVTVTALQPCENQKNTWSVVRMWADSEGGGQVKYGLFSFLPSVHADASSFENTGQIELHDVGLFTLERGEARRCSADDEPGQTGIR